jgi:Holliday junction resolvasome RuvABC endonuclease subunit
VITIKILNLDQSTRATGYSGFENKVLQEHGVLKVKNEKSPVFDRMKEMVDMIENLINEYQPDYITLENTQKQVNVDVFKTLSQLQGVIIKLLFDMDIGFSLVYPTEWRKTCEIKERKRDDQKLAAIQYIKDNFELDMQEDEAEATCIGVWSNENITKE